MRNKKLKLSAILFVGLGLTGVQAQEAIPTTGGNASGSGGSVSYSVGQIVYTTDTGTNGSVAQGVQQPFEISVVGIDEAKGITLQCSVYPNPTMDFLILKVKNFSSSICNYQLYDLNGQLIKSQKLDKAETNIPMENLVAKTYFLKITEGNKEVKTFKIIKN